MNSARCYLAAFWVLFAINANGKDEKPAASLSVIPGQSQVQVGQAVTIQIEVRSAQDLFGAPFYLNYDPRVVEVTKISDGGFLKNGGKQAGFIYKVDATKGRIIVGSTLLGKGHGVSGDGMLANVTFKAIGPGSATLSFWKVDFRNSRNISMPVSSHRGTIEARPVGQAGL